MNNILSIQKNRPALLGWLKTFRQRSLLMLLGAAFCINGMGQSDQRIALGDKYFAAGEYYTAANLYEQFLNPPKKEIPKASFPLNSRRYNQSGTGRVNRMDIVYKQAESYRLANYWQLAADKYKLCLEKDIKKYPEALYWYGVCERSLGKYDTAAQYVNRFIASEAQGTVTAQDAQKELQTIEFIRKQVSRPDTVMYKINKTNTPGSDGKGTYALTGIGGNQFLFTSTVTDSVITNGVNPHHSRLFYGILQDGSLQNAEPVKIDGTNIDLNQGAACFSADKKVLYFTQWKKENGKNISAIYMATRNGNGWSNVVVLSSINKQGYSSRQPYCSEDGKTLFFASDMPGGFGGFDIWAAPLQADGSTGAPVNAGSVINTPGDEQAPFYHAASGSLVFASNGRQGMGGFDLFVSEMKGSQWDTPVNMGYPVNSSRDDIYFFAPRDKELLANAIVGSDRGAGCCLETYSVVKMPKKKMIAGTVRDCYTNEPLADASVTMENTSGKSLKATTGPDGKFSFDVTGDENQNTFHLSKEKYKEKSEGVSVESVNTSDWKMDILQNKSLCLDTIEVKKLVIKAENVVTVYFDFDKSVLKERGISQLDSIYTVLNADSAATIQISGYTDGLGSDAYNKKLSDRRAKACADYLIKKGIASGRISFESFGACCPVEMEKINGRDNPDGRSKNRRALINVSKE